MTACNRLLTLIAILLCLASPAAAQSGWTLSVVGQLPESGRSATERAVETAIPEALLDPSTSFLSERDPDRPRKYRIIIVIDQPEQHDPREICTTAVAPDPGPQQVGLTSTSVTAVFCADDVARAYGRESRIGTVKAGDLTFKYMVRDAIQRLFPLGFDRLPPREAEGRSP